ncbi:hypothetical protein HanHA300_Chr03g0103481 [Helianthus annuus]|nr:hypothetical protein HanHA300_Chr03g0103481 [Helianthus annuus]KAJ0774814.1 hypothetical protein HanOQP8_Chr03g0116131 [Helianthus annuus]
MVFFWPGYVYCMVCSQCNIRSALLVLMQGVSICGCGHLFALSGFALVIVDWLCSCFCYLLS